ncbi:hypothetical protein [Pseudovibrio exalbescens]|uniref:hypothetical protein n=1 Tax=Pseudovibrio exalbescens TaxID=197461 RepID=UPI000B1E81BD|nr:hypothetical protein [Pseudovibrio exalbescens]
MDDRSLGLTCDRVKMLRDDTATPDHRGCHPGPAQRRSGIQHWKSECQHLAPDVIPDLIRHPEQHGTENAATSLLDPGSGAGVTEVGWSIGLRASLVTA